MTQAKILLADDHALVRAGLRDALNSVPDIHIIGEASNGLELLDSLANLHPDLLVMDVNMPDFEPVTAVEKMRALYPEMKILVVSAFDDQSYVVGLLSAGVDGYHLKDQPLADLQLAVRRILDGGRWISDPLLNRLVNQQAPSREPASKQLTRRQRQLLYMLTQGYNNQKIALLMELSVKTIENHLTALYRAIGVESRLEANRFASQHPELLTIHETEPLPEHHAAGAITVLVVDDNPRYRAQLGKLINRTYSTSFIYEAEDIADAIQLAKRIHPRLAFIDVVLHDEDGIECARQIKAISPETRMILVSAYPDREFRHMGMSAGAIAFLDKKDIDSATMRQVIEDALI